jgi:radical SAM superfamily enzyme YgiQ (UPF0313 family)
MRLPYPPYNLVEVMAMTPLIPLGTAYIAGALRDGGFDTKVADLTFVDKRRLDVDVLKRGILDQEPDAVGISALTWTILQAYQLSDALKEERPDLHITIGGPHSSALPRRTLEECESLDAAIMGEGEYVYRDYLKRYFNERNFNPSSVNMPGIMYRHKGKIYGEHQPVYLQDLDALPMPARDLFNLEKYREVGSTFLAKKTPVASIITSRGCPQRCIFCCRSASGYGYRERSADSVVKEIVNLKELGFNEVQIPDDNFTHDRPRVKDICGQIQDLELDMSFDLPNGIRVDHVDKETMQLMYDTGFYAMHLGVESLDQHVLKSIRKAITVEQVERAVKITKEIGFNIILYIIIGLPGSSYDAEMRTLEKLKELDVEFTFSICTPYPGSPLWDIKQEELKDISWERFDETLVDDPIYIPDDMTREELQEVVDIFNDHKLRPKF